MAEQYNAKQEAEDMVNLGGCMCVPIALVFFIFFVSKIVEWVQWMNANHWFTGR